MVDVCTLSYEAGNAEYEDLPYTQEPVWILGKAYSALYDRSEIRQDIASRIWMTYRKNFSPIGNTGPTCDQGWGCMLRCGQMVMAQALVNRHLGRDWQWRSGDTTDKDYLRILSLFQDKKSACYSIQQIAQMGVSEGKAVGEWFGPNTIAQVLRKLCVYDEWSGIRIHVAMDNTVVIDDMKSVCQRVESGGGSDKSPSSSSSSPSSLTSSPRRRKHKQNHVVGEEATSQQASVLPASNVPDWCPLLLFIPLRLGLSEMNPSYAKSLKACFALPQSLGIIGGKPNHAHYFIGYIGDELIYLDPHTTQPCVDVTSPTSHTSDALLLGITSALDLFGAANLTTPLPFSQSPQPSASDGGCSSGGGGGGDGDSSGGGGSAGVKWRDGSYHCQYVSRMRVSALDPSIALAFYCHTEAQLDQLCAELHKNVIACEKQPMFEICKERPSHWTTARMQPARKHKDRRSSNCSGGSSSSLRQYDTSDDDFELL